MNALVNDEEGNIQLISEIQLQEIVAGLVDLKLSELKKQENPSHPFQRISREQLSKLYGVTYPTIHKWMQKGMPYQKLGRKTVFKANEAEKWLNENGHKI